jgi:hypothetical protein
MGLKLNTFAGLSNLIWLGHPKAMYVNTKFGNEKALSDAAESRRGLFFDCWRWDLAARWASASSSKLSNRDQFFVLYIARRTISCWRWSWNTNGLEHRRFFQLWTKRFLRRKLWSWRRAEPDQEIARCQPPLTYQFQFQWTLFVWDSKAAWQDLYAYCLIDDQNYWKFWTRHLVNFLHILKNGSVAPLELGEEADLAGTAGR